MQAMQAHTSQPSGGVERKPRRNICTGAVKRQLHAAGVIWQKLFCAHPTTGLAHRGGRSSAQKAQARAQTARRHAVAAVHGAGHARAIAGGVHRSGGLRYWRAIRLGGIRFTALCANAQEQIGVIQLHAGWDAAGLPVLDALHTAGLDISQPLSQARWPAQEIDQFTVAHAQIKHHVDSKCQRSVSTRTV